MSGVLVTGGAGYIGSHIVRRLTGEGRRVVVLDDLSEGHRAAVAEGVDLVQADFADGDALNRLLGAEGLDLVVHMAANCLVGESVEDPAKYYDNNLVKSLRLLEAARRHEVRGVVFSSTAAVYGEPVDLPIREEHPLVPTNPYGETKLAFERALAWYHGAYGVPYASLRYFNAAGAHPDGDIGEHHLKESHLIPRLLQAVIDGGPPTPIFGEDWPTSDGTCIRDYIHVVDLAEAHVLALQALETRAFGAAVFNLGNGQGFSVREVVDTIASVTGNPPPTEPAPRRAGDPAILVASAEQANRRLGWDPRYPGLEEIVASAWRWHAAHPRGYDDR